MIEVSCDWHRFFNSASVSDCCSIQRTPEVKSSPRAGGTLPYLQTVHMDSACLSVQLKLHGLYRRVSREERTRHMLVGASGANWRLCLTWLSLLLVVPIERLHGLQHSLQGGLDGQDEGTMAREQLPFAPTNCKGVIP